MITFFQTKTYLPIFKFIIAYLTLMEGQYLAQHNGTIESKITLIIIIVNKQHLLCAKYSVYELYTH